MKKYSMNVSPEMKERYTNAIVDMYLISHRNNGLITTTEMKDVIAKYKASQAMPSTMRNLGYLVDVKKVGLKLFKQFTKSLAEIDVIKIINENRKNTRENHNKNRRKRTRHVQSVEIVPSTVAPIVIPQTGVTLSREQMKEMVMAYMDGKEYTLNVPLTVTFAKA